MEILQDDKSTTRAVNTVILRDNVLKKLIHAEIYKVLRTKLNELYLSKEAEVFKQKWISFKYKEEQAFYNTETQYAIPVKNHYSSDEESIMDKTVVKLDIKTTRTIFDKSLPEEIVKGIKASKTFQETHWIGINGMSYCFETEQFADWMDDDTIHLNLISVSDDDFRKNVLSRTYETTSDSVFNQAVKVLKERQIDELSETEIDELVSIFSLNREQIEKETNDRVMTNYDMTTDVMDFYTEELLACDTYRVELERYDKKCLEDVNLGHWELWERSLGEEGQVEAKVERNLIARNPVADIHEDGLIGIDFGTKSTIVSKRDGNNKVNLMRIGIGQLNKAAEAHHYENPTIMEFVNLEKFIEDYHSKNGRPQTSINDLTVSHKADNSLKNCSESDFFYSYFYDIKQWCGDTDRKIKIIDQKGKERLLPAFTDLKAGEFNPLELYAYYLGLYINNMRNGIYLDYILSFPVTYKKAVKEKILKSFTEGLKRSLPDTILNDENIMQKFRVRQGVSEPAAYAITALQGYGFKPTDEEKVLYSIFDFGGGTTDFDFGVWRHATKDRTERRYNYVIEHFGSEGDMYLGGENLLELMAFEIFKANAKFLQTGTKKEDGSKVKKVGFSFSKPKECDPFAGSETLIANSQEAKRNTKQLMEVLRPFWEGIVEIADEELNEKDKKEAKCESKVDDTNAEHDQENKEESVKYYNYEGYRFKASSVIKNISENGQLTVDLFDKNGNRQAGQTLYVKKEDEGIDVNLIEILEKRINSGVENFFSSIQLAFNNDTARNSGTDDIKIFLAGNSSKSPILRKCFDKYINEANADIKEKKGTDGNHFKLYPPLGTEEAIKLQKEMGIEIQEEIDAPTGKTGVAYGLIAGREGGKIKVISENTADQETKFRYNLGEEQDQMFCKLFDRNDIEYGKWMLFIDAGVEDFEIYYTSLPSADKMSVNDTGIYNKRCRLPHVDELADVYIRAVSPDEIEYAVSKGEEPREDTEVIRKKLES